MACTTHACPFRSRTLHDWRLVQHARGTALEMEEYTIQGLLQEQAARDIHPASSAIQANRLESLDHDLFSDARAVAQPMTLATDAAGTEGLACVAQPFSLVSLHRNTSRSATLESLSIFSISSFSFAYTATTSYNRYTHSAQVLLSLACNLFSGIPIRLSPNERGETLLQHHQQAPSRKRSTPSWTLFLGSDTLLEHPPTSSEVLDEQRRFSHQHRRLFSQLTRPCASAPHETSPSSSSALCRPACWVGTSSAQMASHNV